MTDFTPVPKPVPAIPKRRAFGSTLPAPESSSLGRNLERQRREWLRAYGSEDRVAWIKQYGCVICGKKPSENAHVRGGGAGRKADARFIIPLCTGHHRELHRDGIESFAASYSIDLEATAEKFEAAWQEYQREAGSCAR